MAALITRALRTFCNLSSLSTFTREPVSSSARNILVRVIATHGMHTPRILDWTSPWWRFPNAAPNFSTSGNDNTSGGHRNKRPPADLSVLFPGRDDEHWLIIMDHPEGKPGKEEMIDKYVKTLATVVGSEEAAIKAIYSVSFDRYHGFGCQISKEDAQKLDGVPGVFRIYQDSYVDPTHKDYGGELFVDGKIVQRPPERQRLVDRTDEERNQRARQGVRSRIHRQYQGPININSGPSLDISFNPEDG